MVTGAASGIGLATARLLAAHGICVCAIDINEKSLEELQNELGTNCFVAVCDVSKENDVKKAIAKFSIDVGKGFDIIVSNAGILVQNYFNKANLKEYKQMIDTNSFGAVNIIFQCLPLLEKKARVIITSSAAAIYGLPKFAVYSGSKMFLRAFCEALAGELKNAGIVIADVMPFFVRTGMTEDMTDKSFRKASRQTPEQIAKVIYKATKSKKRHHYVGFKTKMFALATRIFGARCIGWFLRGYLNVD